MQILHRPLDLPFFESVVAFELDFTDLHLRSFIYVENYLERGRRHLADFRFNRGELAAALGQVLLQNIACALDLVRVVLRFDAEADSAILEAVQNLGHGNRLHALVLDRPYDAPLYHHKGHDPTRLARLAFDADFVEASGVPERHEIAMHGLLIVLIALLRIDERSQRFLRYTPRSAEIDDLDNVPGTRFGGLGRRRRRNCFKQITFLLFRRLLLPR